jgi:hypothetical protein
VVADLDDLNATDLLAVQHFTDDDRRWLQANLALAGIGALLPPPPHSRERLEYLRQLALVLTEKNPFTVADKERFDSVVEEYEETAAYLRLQSEMDATRNAIERYLARG